MSVKHLTGSYKNYLFNPCDDLDLYTVKQYLTYSTIPVNLKTINKFTK